MYLCIFRPKLAIFREAHKYLFFCGLGEEAEGFSSFGWAPAGGLAVFTWGSTYKKSLHEEGLQLGQIDLFFGQEMTEKNAGKTS